MGAALWLYPALLCAAWLAAVICIVRHFDKTPAGPKEQQ
jgi:hypothetical protein